MLETLVILASEQQAMVTVESLLMLRRIVVRTDLKKKEDGEGKKGGGRILETFDLIKFQRTNQNTCITQTPIVRVGQPVEKRGRCWLDGPSMDRGELALRKKCLGRIYALGWLQL